MTGVRTSVTMHGTRLAIRIGSAVVTPGTVRRDPPSGTAGLHQPAAACGGLRDWRSPSIGGG